MKVSETLTKDADINTTVDKNSAPNERLPRISSYTSIGFGAGLLAGLSVAIVDSIRLWVLSSSGLDWSLPGYGTLLYGPLLGVLGAFSGAALAVLCRRVRIPVVSPVKLAMFVGSVLFYVFVLAIGYFYLKRDLFGEKAGLVDPKMLGSMLAFAVGLLLTLLGKSWLVVRFAPPVKRQLLTNLVGPSLYVVITGLLLILWVASPPADVSNASLRDAQNVAGKPNVVLVMVDTLRADYVGAYGNEMKLTPHLDALAADGVLYKNAFANASWTRPSVATILTGRYPSSHTATLKGSILPDEVTTIPEVLLGEGYETIGIASNYNLTPFFNFDQGFVDYHYLSPNLPFGSSDAQAKLIFIEVAKKIGARLRGKREIPADYYVIGEEVTQVSLDQLDQRDKNRPFFLFTSYMDPHDPYFRHPFDGYGISQRANPHPTPDMIPEMKELYAGEVKYWDQTFGDLIDGLKQRGLYDDTLIVVTSDHGEEFGEHGNFWHGKTLYDEQLRIVNITKFPTDMGADLGVKGGEVIDDWTALVDVAPKIIDWLGIFVPKEMQGKARHDPRQPVFAEEDHEGNVLSSVLYRSEGGADVKLIKANEGNPRGLDPFELYRIDEDPGETDNLAQRTGALTAQAMKELNTLEKLVAEGAVKAGSVMLSQEGKEQLIRLGYLEDETNDKDETEETEVNDTNSQKVLEVLELESPRVPETHKEVPAGQARAENAEFTPELKAQLEELGYFEKTGIGCKGPVKISLLDQNIQGNLPADMLQDAFENNQKIIATCYKTALQKKPDLEGTVTLEIVAQGQTNQSSLVETTLEDESVEKCLLDNTSKWKLGPKAKAAVTIAATVSFAPPEC